MDATSVHSNIHEQIQKLKEINWWHWAGHIAGFLYVASIHVFKSRAESGLWKRYTSKTVPQPSLMQDVGDAMSDFSNFLHEVANAFEKVVAAAPPAQQATLQAASSQVSTAATAVQGALPALAIGVANLALDAIPGGAGFEGVADMVLQMVIAELQSHLLNPPATATVSTVTTVSAPKPLGVAGV